MNFAAEPVVGLWTIHSAMVPSLVQCLRPSLSFGMLALAVGCQHGSAPRAEVSSDPAHIDAKIEKPLPWPKGIIPYDVSKLSAEQAATVRQAMQLWMETGANLRFVPRTAEAEYVDFTGKTDAGNNTTFNGYRKGARQGGNITAFWWRQGPWMPAHELGLCSASSTSTSDGTATAMCHAQNEVVVPLNGRCFEGSLTTP